MKKFSIKQLENFSEVKAHTIRIWEKRYRIFQPDRSKGNIRHYSLNDVKLLLNLVLLIKNGAKISELARTETSAIDQKIKLLTADQARRNKAVSELIICMFSIDVEQLEDILDSCILSWDVDITIRELIIPFLEKVQLLSYKDSSSEAHFAVTAIRRKLILGLERVNPSTWMTKSALLFLGEGEHYDLLLLYMAYILKMKGMRVLYMGTNIPRENLKKILTVKKPDFLYTYIPHKQKFKMQELIPFLDEHLPDTTFVVAGCEKIVSPKESLRNVKFIHYKDVDNSLGLQSI